jgi:hypothetical protein
MNEVRWPRYVGRSRSAYRIFVGKPEGQTPHGRVKRRWKYNIKMVNKEIAYKGVEWIHLVHGTYQW